MTVNDGLITSGVSPNYGSWRLAYSLEVLANEISLKWPQLTCLGTIGNATHEQQGVASDHNPFVRFGGLGICRALDVGGPDDVLKQLRQQLWNLYASTDGRVYMFGYMKGCSDNLINNWGLPFGTHVDMGDSGHLHISVTQLNGYAPSANGYVAAIDSRADWGLLAPPPARPEEPELIIVKIAPGAEKSPGKPSFDAGAAYVYDGQRCTRITAANVVSNYGNLVAKLGDPVLLTYDQLTLMGASPGTNPPVEQ